MNFNNEFDELPEDILLDIFSRLDVFTLLICEEISKKYIKTKITNKKQNSSFFSCRWNLMSKKTWMTKKTFFVDHFYYQAKRKYDFGQKHFERFCDMLLIRYGRQIRFMQLAHVPHDQPKMYFVRGLPMTRSAMRTYLQRINVQSLSIPKWNHEIPGIPLIVPDLSSLMPYLNGKNIKNLCLYNVKLSENSFECLKNFQNLNKLILWPTAVSWNRLEKWTLIAAFEAMKQLKTLKLFALSPDLLSHLPLSVKNLTIHLVNTIVARNDDETRNLFQINLHKFIESHPDLTNITILIRPRHMNYSQLIEHLSTFTKNLRSLKCQFNFKKCPLNISSLQNLKHFGVQQNFVINTDHEKDLISLNIAESLSSLNGSVEKLTFKNCYLKNFPRLPSWLNVLSNIKQLNLINVFEAEDFLSSLFLLCPNLQIINLNNVKPLTSNVLVSIGTSCKTLETLSVAVEDDFESIKVIKVIGQFSEWWNINVYCAKN